MATILIVDDRPTNRQFLLTLLGYTGHRLLEAADGAEALEVARAERPDTVITDILMPTMNGYELVQQLRADAELAGTPVIFYTATYHTAEARALAESCGVQTLLPKPSEPQEILDAVNNALGAAAGVPARPSVAAAPGAAQVRQLYEVGDRLTQYVQDLRSTGLTMDEMLARSAQLLEEKERVLQLSQSFGDSIENLQRVTATLSALIEAGLELMAEHDPVRLTERFFDTASKIVPSSYAVVAMLDERGEQLEQVLTKGLDATLFAPGREVTPLIASLLSLGVPVRRHATGSRGAVPHLPADHPPVRSFLGLSIATRERAYGWVYFADRYGETAFTEEDERVAAILAAELAVLYENAMLYNIVQRHAAHLEMEAAERKRAQEALAESETRFRQMAETIREVFFLAEGSTERLLYISPAYEEIWGQSREELYADPGAWLGSVHPEDRQRINLSYRAYQATGRLDEEYRILRADGVVRWVEARTFPVLRPDGQPHRIAGIARDVTARKLAELRIQRLNRVYAVLSGINALIVRVHRREELFRESCRIAVADGGFALAWVGIVDRERMHIRPVAWQGADPGFLHRLQGLSLDAEAGYAPGIVARAVMEKSARISNDVAVDPDVPLGLEYSARGVRAMTVLPLTVGGEVLAVLVLHAAEPDFFDEEEMKLLLELAGDISFALDHVAKSERLDYLAYYDALTGLANRTFFHERLTQRLLAAARRDGKLALALVDVQRFKAINDDFGRQVGDRLLKLIAERLKAGSEDASELARVGADQFALLLPNLAADADVGILVEQRLRACFDEPFRVDETELRVGAKAGAAVFPADAEDGDTLFANAEAALEKAGQVDERYVLYLPQMTEHSSGRMTLENELRRALVNDEFALYYQPKVDLETRQVVGVEALLRWRSPQRGLVMPNVFIPLLEETGLILEVGAWVLRRAVYDHRHLLRQGVAAPRIAANVSARQLRHPGFVDVMEEVIRMGAKPTGLDIEVTESVLMEDVTGNIGKLREIGELGVNVAIDDFGTGYSSLAYLAKLPVQALKVDRSFVETMLSDPDTTTLVSMIISLAHSLRLSVVAEGVETEEQARMLRLLRCDEMQGYLIGRPMPLEELTPKLPRRL